MSRKADSRSDKHGTPHLLCNSAAQWGKFVGQRSGSDVNEHCDPLQTGDKKWSGPFLEDACLDVGPASLESGE
jgi:hypothetical protein